MNGPDRFKPYLSLVAGLLLRWTNIGTPASLRSAGRNRDDYRKREWNFRFLAVCRGHSVPRGNMQVRRCGSSEASRFPESVVIEDPSFLSSFQSIVAGDYRHFHFPVPLSRRIGLLIGAGVSVTGGDRCWNPMGYSGCCRSVEPIGSSLMGGGTGKGRSCPTCSTCPTVYKSAVAPADSGHPDESG